MRVKKYCYLLSCFSFLFLAGCAVTKQAPLSNTASEVGGASDYVIGAGDTLTVFVWRNPELSTDVIVRPDGDISIPLVEDVSASGETPTALARKVEERLKHYIRDPVVTVIVKNFVGAYGRQIRVVGAAAKPNSLPYKTGMTLLDVMIAVGGLGEFADGNKAKIVRSNAEQQVELNVRLEDLIQDGDIKHNINMRPGDVLIIPESWF